MNSYLRITGRTITIWLCACLINAMLCGIALFFVNGMYLEIIGDIFLIFVLSLFFSAPGFFIFWVILLIKFCFYITDRALFRSALITGFVLSSVTAYFGSKIFASEFMGYASIPASCIILSAVSSIMLHFKYFKKIK
jgi:hypothetical protein